MADEQPPAVDPGGAAQGIAQVAKAAEQVIDASSSAAAANPKNATLDLLMDVTLQVAVEVGRTRMTIQDLLQLGAGSVVELEKLAGEALDIFINGKLVATGEAVIVNEKFGVRFTNIVSQAERVGGLAL